MGKVCAWCNNEVRPSEVSNALNSVILKHGVCSQCAQVIMIDSGRYLTSYLDTMEEPVILVGDDVRVISANQAAKIMLNKNEESIQDRLGGDLFECAHACLEGGCGKTEYCGSCLLRNSITDTMRTGCSHLRVPASLNHGTLDFRVIVNYRISTEKVEDKVLVRIDEAGPPIIDDGASATSVDPALN